MNTVSTVETNLGPNALPLLPGLNSTGSFVISPGATVGCGLAPVRRYLRHRLTSHYYRENGWTSKIEEARIFSDVIEAIRVCAEHELVQVDLVLRLSGSKDDLFCTELR